MVASSHDMRHLVPTSWPIRQVDPNELGQQVEHYFHIHPEVARSAFLLDAVRHELAVREQADRQSNEVVFDETHLRESVDNVDRSARLASRVAELNYQRHGVWPRLRRFFTHARLA